MKSMLKFIAAAVIGAAALTACGGHYKKPDEVVVAQPDYKQTDTVAGTGATAAANLRAGIIYTGYLYDASKPDGKGAKVESTLDRADTVVSFTLGLGQPLTGTSYLVGLDRAVLGTATSPASPMKVGGSRTVVLPASLAYGLAQRNAVEVTTPAGAKISYPAIPSNSPMVYDIQLVALTDVATPVGDTPPTANVVKELTVGTGAMATSGKWVKVRYTLWVWDGMRAVLDYKGTQMDSNVSATNPLQFQVDGKTSTGSDLIKGFQYGVGGWKDKDGNVVVEGMRVGGTRRITVIPADGYGSAGSGTIAPNTTLIFEIKLESVKDAVEADGPVTTTGS